MLVLHSGVATGGGEEGLVETARGKSGRKRVEAELLREEKCNRCVIVLLFYSLQRAAVATEL